MEGSQDDDDQLNSVCDDLEDVQGREKYLHSSDFPYAHRPVVPLNELYRETIPSKYVKRVMGQYWSLFLGQFVEPHQSPHDTSPGGKQFSEAGITRTSHFNGYPPSILSRGSSQSRSIIG